MQWPGLLILDLVTLHYCLGNREYRLYMAETIQPSPIEAEAATSIVIDNLVMRELLTGWTYEPNWHTTQILSWL